MTQHFIADNLGNRGFGTPGDMGRRRAQQAKWKAMANDPSALNLQGVDKGSVANWFAAQDPKIQMYLAAGGRGLENPLSTPWGTIGTGWGTVRNGAGGQSGRLMEAVRGASPDWNNAGAQLINYASYSNPDLWKYTGTPGGAGGQTGNDALRGIMNFTPGGGSWGPSQWDSFGGESALKRSMGPNGNANVPYTGTNLSAASYINPSNYSSGLGPGGLSSGLNTNPRWNPGAGQAVNQLINGANGSWDPRILPYIGPGQTGDTQGSYNYNTGWARPQQYFTNPNDFRMGHQ